MSEKNERAKRATKKATTPQVIISLETEGNGHRITVNHPENIPLAINMISDALKLVALQNIKQPEPKSNIIQPTQREVHLVH